ncbi:MAG: RnfABCDGE type electron transport complex subunit D [Lachnospiraceae bacterium]|nr:RnfABCDGE type electron transport complex subunit D [Lachnospiraceae bacterium]
MNQELYHVSANPHVRDKVTTQNLMFYVILALLPTTIFGFVNFGLSAIINVVITTATCVIAEYAWQKLMHKKITINDMSAALTGLLLGINLPPQAPYWIGIIGGLVAIIVVKQLFGGLGQNFMNPALGGRCFLVLSFALPMTNWTYNSAFGSFDAATMATPLAMVKAGETVNWVDMFIGFHGGTIGETSAVCILIGGLFLIWKKVISPIIPCAYLGTLALFVLLFGGHGFDMNFVLCHICGGGVMLGAFFMATDYVTSPITDLGKLIFGIILGVLTGVFRIFGPGAEGVSYAIIFSNLLVPLIEKWTVPAAFGKGGKK